MDYDVVVVGTSWGGLHALSVILTGIPASFPSAIVIVQHRRTESGDELLKVLQRVARLPVTEPEDKDRILGGRAYLAPSGYHLLLETGNFALSVDAPVAHARPSIDVLFESAADAYGSRAVGVILTGASADGARGLATIKARGGYAIAQDPEEAEIAIMPNAALRSTPVDQVLPLAAIAPALVSLILATPR